MTDATVALVRRWSVDWLNGRHPEVCEQILAPEYALLIGGFLLGPRESYVPATQEQFGRYPGLVVTAHQLVVSGDRVALWFTEHGASDRHVGRAAAWSGIALFRGNGTQLTHCYAEEDYYARRRQLSTGHCDPIAPPAPAPWDAAAQPRNGAAEQVVREWLAGPDPHLPTIAFDDEPAGQPATGLLAVEDCAISELFSAGEHVAFSAVQSGCYTGGLASLDDLVGQPMRLSVAGLVQVRDGAVVGGRVVRDRLGAARALRAAVTVEPIRGGPAGASHG